MKKSCDYYHILHVQPDAPEDIIKASYRTIMQKLKVHPDLGGDGMSAAILNEAYATLSNRKKRTEYDKKLQCDLKTPPSPAGKKRRTGKVDKTRKEKKTPEYWKDQSVCPFCGTPKPAHSEYDSDYVDCKRCNSPLKTVVRLEITGHSRRKIQRVSKGAPVRFYTHHGITKAKPGTIMDLSPEGMQFTAATELGSGQVIRIVSDLVSASARICYCKHDKNTGQYAIGVQFLTLQFHHQVGTFLSESA